MFQMIEINKIQKIDIFISRKMFKIMGILIKILKIIIIQFKIIIVIVLIINLNNGKYSKIRVVI